MSQRDIDPVFSTTTPIRYCNYDGGGTGFFFNHREKTYLVTNRHVVSPDDENINPDEAYIWLRNATSPGETNRHKIRINIDGSRRWRGHPRLEEDVDLAVVPLNPHLSSLDDLFDDEKTIRSGNLAFTADYFLHENVQADQRVSIIGYPGEFMDRNTRFPVRRNALISSPYGYAFENRPFFLTDARMHPGTSGSPVVMSTGGMQMTNGDVPDNRSKTLYLLGIHSATFYGTGFEEQSDRGESSEDGPNEHDFKLDLNVAWYSEILVDILNTDK